MVPVVLMDVDPVIRVAPLIVPSVTNEPLRVLLVRVSTSALVTIMPVVGKVAVDGVPVPPSERGKIPVTALACDKFTEPKYGDDVPSVGATRT